MRSVMKLGVGALLLFALIGRAEAHDARLVLVLSSIDEIPTRAQLVAAGAGERGEALLAIALDESLTRYPRMRAAGLLGLFGEAAPLLRIIEAKDVSDPEVKVQAIASYGALEGAIPKLVRLLGDGHEELRAAAARALSRRSEPAAKRELRRALEAGRLRSDVAKLVRARLD